LDISREHEINISTDLATDKSLTLYITYSDKTDLVNKLASHVNGRVFSEGSNYRITKKQDSFSLIKTNLPNNDFERVFKDIKRIGNHFAVYDDYDLTQELKSLENFNFFQIRLTIIKLNKLVSDELDFTFTRELKFSYDSQNYFDYIFNASLDLKSDGKDNNTVDIQDLYIDVSTAQPVDLFFGTEEIREVLSVIGDNGETATSSFERIKTGLDVDFIFYEKDSDLFTKFIIKDDSNITADLKNSFDYSNYIQLSNDNKLLVKYSTKQTIKEKDFFLFIPTGYRDVQRDFETKVFLQLTPKYKDLQKNEK